MSESSPSNASPVADAVGLTNGKNSPTPANTSEKPRIRGTGIKGLGGLGDLQKEIERRKQAQPQEEEEESQKIYEINPEVNLPQAEFQAILDRYCTRLKAEGKMNFASSLEHANSRLEHNCWHLRVGNELSLVMIEKEKTLLPYLRDESGIKDLFLKIVVDESVKQPEESIPYSPEDKLRVMGERNPALNRLQEIFSTRIIY